MPPRPTRYNTPDTEPADNWRDLAACAPPWVDPELFFPNGKPKKGSDAYEQVKQAKRICAQCAVAAKCLEYAMETNEQFGIWGGTTEDERREMKRHARRNRQARLGAHATSETMIY